MRERLNFRNFLRILAPPALYLVVLQASQMAVLLLVFGMTMLEYAGVFQAFLIGGSPEQLSFFATAVGAAAGIPLFRALLLRDELRSPSDYRYGKVPPAKYLYAALLGFFLAAGMNQLLGFLRVDQLFPGYEQVADALYSAGLWPELLVLGGIVPVTEELIFRGLVYERMKACMSVRAAAFWCSLFFGVYHGNISQGIYAFVLGLAMVYAKEQYQSLLAPVLFHMSANSYSVLATNTGWMDWMYESEALFLAAMILALALSVVLLWRIQEDVQPERIRKNREWQHTDSE